MAKDLNLDTIMDRAGSVDELLDRRGHMRGHRLLATVRSHRPFDETERIFFDLVFKNRQCFQRGINQLLLAPPLNPRDGGGTLACLHEPAMWGLPTTIQDTVVQTQGDRARRRQGGTRPCQGLLRMIYRYELLGLQLRNTWDHPRQLLRLQNPLIRGHTCRMEHAMVVETERYGVRRIKCPACPLCDKRWMQRIVRLPLSGDVNASTHARYLRERERFLG